MHRLVTRLALLAAVTLSLSSSAAAADDAPIVAGPLGAQLDDYLSRLESFGLHGAILVVKGDDIVLRKGYGIADHSTARPITTGTMFDIGSLSKQFVAAAILKLQADGHLHVDDAIRGHLPGVPEDKADITIHHLLTHTSGLPYMPGTRPPLELPLESEPGAQVSYSNPGYTLLAMIIEARTGKPYTQFIHDELFAPAGLMTTAFRGDKPWPTADVARSYTDGTDQGAPDTKPPDPQFRGAGDACTTIADLARWELALRAGSIIPAPLVDELFKPHARNEGSRVAWGYGWMIAETIRGTRIVMHQGNFGGFNSDFRRYLDEDLTIVFLSNHFVNGRSMRDAAVNNVSKLINGGDVIEPPRTLEVGAEDLAALVGEYRWPDLEHFVRVHVAGDGLAVSASTPWAMSLLYASAPSPEEAAFTRDATERAMRIVQAAATGDAGPLREFISRSLPFEGAWDDLRRRLEESQSAHGPLRSVTPEGTTIEGGPEHGRTSLLLAFDDGVKQRVHITWARGRLIHIDITHEPLARRFRPVTPRSFVAFDIFTGRAVTLTFDVDVVHEPPWVRIGDEKDGNIARRISLFR